jgi:hypothetical protein
MKKNLLWFLSIVYVLLMLGCMDESAGGYCQRDLEFEFHAQTQGLQDTVAINDTIWFHLEIDSIATDLTSGEEFDIFEDNDFSSWILSVDNLDSFDLRASTNFDYHSKIGNSEIRNIGGGSFATLDFASHVGKKIIHIGIIPKKIGNYFIGYDYINSIERNAMRVILPNCLTKVEVRRATNAEDRSQNNYYLVEESPLSEYQDYEKEAFNRNGSFAFHVRE